MALNTNGQIVHCHPNLEESGSFALEEPDIESKPCDLQEDTETDVDYYSDQFLSFDEVQDEEKDTQEPKGQFEDVTDKVIKAFTVKRRKALIDQEEYEEDLVDYEVSVKRLFILVSSFATLLAMTSTILLVVWIDQMIPTTSDIVHQNHVPQDSKLLSYPHLMLLFNDGSMEIYEFSANNSYLKHSWSFKVPEYDTGYILSISGQNIFVLYPGGKKDITMLSNERKSNLTHQSIKQSKMPSNMLFDSRFVQLNNFLWIFGGGRRTGVTFSEEDCRKSKHLQFYDRKTLIWNTQRQLFYPGPKLPIKDMVKGCPISLNRTHVMILYVNDLRKYCLVAWVYSFRDFQWKEINECLYEVVSEHLLQLSDEYNYTIAHDLQCTSTIDKSHKR